jgi:glutaredoxin
MTYTIYSMKGCNWCVRARNLLMTKGIKPVMIDIGEDQGAKDFVVGEGHETVPQAYFQSAMGVTEHIGGYEALEAHLKRITH